MSEKKYPPLIQQFIDIQKQYPDAIIATEVGGFFEIWAIDGYGYAPEASQILDTVLTRRDKSDLNSPQMTGFPSFAAEGYFKKLVQAGKTVVVVSQEIRGKKSDKNKQVTRRVSQILSPGTVIENIQRDAANYFASIYVDELISGVALIDVSTGEVLLTELKNEQLSEFLELKKPSEILSTGSTDWNKIEYQIKPNQLFHKNQNPVSKLSSCGVIFSDIYNLENPTSNPTFSLTVLGIEFVRFGSLALANLFNFLTNYNKLLLKKVGNPVVYSKEDHLYVPVNAFLSLDVFKTQDGRDHHKDTLIGILDRCKTAMGQRKLRDWIQSPLCDLEKIEKRLSIVEDLLNRRQFFEELKNVYDFARLSRRMVLSRLLPHEIQHFYSSLEISERVLKASNEIALTHQTETIRAFVNSNISIPSANISEFDISFFSGDLKNQLEQPFLKWKKAEHDLNKLKNDYENLLETKGKLRIVEKTESIQLIGSKSIGLIAKEKGISVSIKTSDCSITESDWTNKAKECLYLKHHFLALAQSIWEDFQKRIVELFGTNLIEISDKIAEIDVLSNFAFISFERNYTRPVLSDSSKSYVSFKKLRHPIVELSDKLTEGFVSNDVSLGLETKTMVLYGANSAGKSTILKSVALNVIMAQCGCFIAAAPSSSLSIFDSIFTRMSNFDSLSEGLSTFTMEMSELQSALKYKTQKTLFLFDEIGRGTSVEDGAAIAYATLAYLDNPNLNFILLFATHYHQLATKIKELKSVEIKNVSCYSDENGKLIFSRKLENGEGLGSYGIEVAKSCGIPEEIIRIAMRFNKEHFQIKKSLYNSKIEGTKCDICRENPIQETHHIIEQKQGTIKLIHIEGEIKKINDPLNLLQVCGTCHRMVTNGTIIILRKEKSTDGFKVIFKSN